jgi:hypothetical protein
MASCVQWKHGQTVAAQGWRHQNPSMLWPGAQVKTGEKLDMITHDRTCRLVQGQVIKNPWHHQ